MENFQISDDALYGDATREDALIWMRLNMTASAICAALNADTRDYWFMRDYAGCDPEVIKDCVRMEAYAADMYGAPEYA